jgi:predicted ribonuclease YlaK
MGENTTSNKTYDDIFMPLSDVYALAGPRVFNSSTNFNDGSKNAIVLSIHDLNAIENMGSVEFGYGGRKALEYIMKNKITENNNIRTTYSGGPGLDIHIYKGTDREDSLRLMTNDHPDQIKVLTRKPSQGINYQMRGMEVEQPKFLLAHAGIVNRGILDGNDDLQNALNENNRRLSIDDASDVLDSDYYMNQFIRFRNEGAQNTYARVTGDVTYNNDLTKIISVDNQRLILLDEEEYKKKLTIRDSVRGDVLGVSPRDMEQYLAMQHLLFNPHIETAFISGGAGSGKTLLAYAAAVSQIIEYSTGDDTAEESLSGRTPKRGEFYEQLLLLKPNDVMGGKSRDPGFLPGTLWDKLEPHLTPYRDAHRETIVDGNIPFKHMFLHPNRTNNYGETRTNKSVGKGMHLSKSREAIELANSGFLRGSSLRNTLVLVDEAQNFTPKEMQSILTRGGVGTTYYIMGDPAQFDNPLCDSDWNGFTYAIQQLLEKPQTGLIKLQKTYRGQTADDVRNWQLY